jgi:hypothetical protein
MPYLLWIKRAGEKITTITLSQKTRKKENNKNENGFHDVSIK